MKILKPVLWVVFGMFSGAGGALVASQSGVVQKPVTGPRFLASPAGTAVDNNAYFIKETRSGGCWLALRWDASNTNLAVAPKEARD